MPKRVTPEQTMAAWCDRVRSFRHTTVQDVFPGNDTTDKAHRANCRILVHRGWLQPDVDDGVPPYRRDLDPTVRYHPSV